MTDASGRPKAVSRASRYASQWAACLHGFRHAYADVALSVTSGQRVLFVGAHPDDETFGAGATLAALGHRGIDTHVLSLTSGGAAFEPVGLAVPGLQTRRQHEFAAACGQLGVQSATILEYPDGALAGCATEIDGILDKLASDIEPTRLLAVWWDDPHPDHRAAGRAALSLAARRGIPVSGFPIWAQHWSDPGTALGKEPTHVISTQPLDRAARARAVACYQSQTAPASVEVEAVLPGWFLSWTDEIAIHA